MTHKILGFFILAGSLAIIFFFETSGANSDAFRIFHWPAIVLTSFGPIGIVLMSTEWSSLRNAWRTFLSTTTKAMERQNNQEAHLMHQTTHQIYKVGTKALEGHLQGKLSPTLKRVFRRLMAKVPLTDLMDLVERERDRTESELRKSLRAVGLGLRMAPSVGMLGTILGMVQLLSHLKDPSNIGSHMSLALLTTFYGLFFSLVLWNPLQNYFESILDIRMRSYEQIIHWLEIMDERKPIQYFEDNLKQQELSTALEEETKKKQQGKPSKLSVPISANRTLPPETRLQ